MSVLCGFFYVCYILVISFLIVLPFAYDLNAKFRFYFKFVLLYFLLTCTRCILTPFAILDILCCGKCKYTACLENYSHDLISWLFVLTWRIEGVENLKKTSLPIIVGNSQGILDFLASKILLFHSGTNARFRNTDKIFFLWENICFTSRESITWYFLDISETPARREMEAIKDSNSLVVPVIISSYYFVDHKEKIFDSGNVVVRVLEPLEILSQWSPEQVHDKVADIVRNAQVNLDAEVVPPTVETLQAFYNQREAAPLLEMPKKECTDTKE